MSTSSTYEVLDPRVQPIPEQAIIAPRPASLGGMSIGLLANGKQNSAELLEMVYEVLADRYNFSVVIAKNKGNASRPCPEDLLDELAERCDVVVTSTGD
jgi:hypothetical protein